MALNGRHELLSLLLQTGITSAQHVLLLLETVVQKKGKLPMLERVVEDLYVYNSYNLVDFNVPKLSEVATSSSNSYGRKKPRASLSRSHL